jgi:hypothetical protein
VEKGLGFSRGGDRTVAIADVLGQEFFQRKKMTVGQGGQWQRERVRPDGRARAVSEVGGLGGTFSGRGGLLGRGRIRGWAASVPRGLFPFLYFFSYFLF